MDQLKKALGWLKQNHFWVLTGLIAIVGLACWYTSSGALGKETSANQATIKQAFNTPKNIASEPFHPNPVINDKQREQVQLRAKTVAEMWQQLYDRQRTEVLKWPEQSLTLEFREAVEKLKFGDEFPIHLATIYQNYISGYFPELPKRIQAKIIEGDGRGGGYNSRPGGGRGDEGGGVLTPDAFQPDYICEWLDQQDVRALLQFDTTPSPLRIWVTQEDLWAYQTLLDVIAATNAAVQADRPDNAAVRTIETLEVGKKAAVVVRSDRIALDANVRATAAGAVAAEGTREGGGMDSGRESQGGPTAEQEQVMLLSRRYIDQDGNPIAVTGGLTNFQSTFGVEYKRLPVRLVLKMDVRSLSFLIAQCANQPLQIEVQEVRINPLDGGAGAGGSRARGAEMGSMSMGRGIGGEEQFPLQPNQAQVVIRGVIYIFNEPSADVLKAASGGDNGLAQN